EKVLANLQRLQKIYPAENGVGNFLPERPEGCCAQQVPDPFFGTGDAFHSGGEGEQHPLSSLSPYPSRLSDSGRPYWQSLARIGLHVAQALDYAHGQGVLHRDIKPSNLILDGQGTVWVTDFGMAKVASDDDQLTHTGDVVGTLRYLAPERLSGQGDARADIYSLGLTLYELLTLHPAFEEIDRNRLVQRLMHQEPPPPRKLNARIPRDLETIVLKAIARDKAQRYQTAAEVASDLRRFLDDEPILARRPSPTERLLRWSRRHPGVAASLMVIVLLLLTATIVSAVAAGRFQRIAREMAILAEQNADLATQRGEERDKAEKAGAEARRRGDAERWERYRSNIAAAS